MEKITLEFYKVYEPGEMQAPFVQPENGNESLSIEMRTVPRYKDQLKFNNKEYFVHDIIYDMDATAEYKVVIKLYRKATLNEMEL
jgi:hypothetical protein